MVARRASEDTAIGEWPVPAGSEVAIWIYMTHRDARWYADPDEFRPERFAPAAEAALPKAAYLPFGAGPRACIGKQFAMIEGVLILAVLAQRFHFDLADGARVEQHARITLTPRHGMPMRLRLR
jgi:cytochrome P450